MPVRVSSVLIQELANDNNIDDPNDVLRFAQMLRTEMRRYNIESRDALRILAMCCANPSNRTVGQCMQQLSDTGARPPKKSSRRRGTRHRAAAPASPSPRARPSVWTERGVQELAEKHGVHAPAQLVP